MAQQYSENDLYRTSTQYKLWSFSNDELASLRSNTNAGAIEHAKSYLSDLSPCLNLVEEVRLVQRYCEQVRSTCDFFKWGINVKATAVQYLKRFYLTNSVMTYPPKEIYKSVLFLASKTESVHMTLGEFARRIKSNQEDILAPEYKIIQSLRFTLDVRQPFRGLRGALMELLNLAEGQAATLPGTSHSPADLQAAFSALPLPTAPPFGPRTLLSPWSPAQPLRDRAHAAYTSARKTLDAPALLTDVYFLYTPPQLYLAALLLADAPLVDFYLSTKLPEPAATGENGSAPLLEQIKEALRACAQMLAEHEQHPVMTKEEKAALEERLERCRDPATKDMVGVSKAAKMGDADGEEKEEKLRRRAEEREKAARDGDVFGGSLA